MKYGTITTKTNGYVVKVPGHYDFSCLTFDEAVIYATGFKNGFNAASGGKVLDIRPDRHCAEKVASDLQAHP